MLALVLLFLSELPGGMKACVVTDRGQSQGGVCPGRPRPAGRSGGTGLCQGLRV